MTDKDSYSVDKANRVRQIRENAVYDRAGVHAVLDAGVVAHVAFIEEDGPVVVPMLYGREGECLYLHGARKARVIRMLESTRRASLNVTLVDGLVLARSAFNSSMNYRSATVFGRPALVEDHDAKIEAMRIISEHVMPGRWDELRAPLEKEVKMTGVIRLDIESASAKIAASTAPDDEEFDYDTPVWAGILPLVSTFETLVDDERLADGVEPSAVVKALEGKTL